MNRWDFHLYISPLFTSLSSMEPCDYCLEGSMQQKRKADIAQKSSRFLHSKSVRPQENLKGKLKGRENTIPRHEWPVSKDTGKNKDLAQTKRIFCWIEGRNNKIYGVQGLDTGVLLSAGATRETAERKNAARERNGSWTIQTEEKRRFPGIKLAQKQQRELLELEGPWIQDIGLPLGTA